MLDTPVEYLKGVGPQKAEALKKEISVFTYRDLATWYPFRYVDRSEFHKVKDIREDMSHVQLRGRIVEMEITGKQRAKRLVAMFMDDTGIVELVWFQGHDWMARKLQTGTEYIVFGKPGHYRGRYNIAHPEIEEAAVESEMRQVKFQPVYNSTEKLKARGLNNEGLRRAQWNLWKQLGAEHVEETLDPALIAGLGLPGRFDALRDIHFPSSAQALERSVKRLKFDELFYIQLRLLKLNKTRARTVRGFVFTKVGETFNTFFSQHLPYELTGAQKRVLREIRTDTGSGKQMNRLLQGDVGSGKTIVALMSMLLAIDNGFQTCLMAPTEILARQHYQTFMQLLGDMNVGISILTGSSRAAERRTILENLASGNLKILIGTHALIEETVKFRNLGLAVIDEQHRFGVEQRARLRDANANPPHMLIMTATPIPRTLAMTLYGDLDTSVIDELPPGRKPVKTVHFTESKRLRMYGIMKEQIALGRQVYVVYPLIQENEKLDYQNLEQGYENIVRDFSPPQYQVSIVHGKLDHEKKEAEVKRFVKGETQIMVATTVIEVGVNIPNATVMVIESAERFGLSQLHQLRGRVGRGAELSYCFLMTGYRLGAESRLRMKTMEETNDGFRISEVDLKLRGPGDIEGTQQSGIADLKLANLAQDGNILQLAREEAGKILEKDPTLELPEHQVYNRQLNELRRNRPDWSKTG